METTTVVSPSPEVNGNIGVMLMAVKRGEHMAIKPSMDSSRFAGSISKKVKMHTLDDDNNRPTSHIKGESYARSKTRRRLSRPWH